MNKVVLFSSFLLTSILLLSITSAVMTHGNPQPMTTGTLEHTPVRLKAHGSPEPATAGTIEGYAKPHSSSDQDRAATKERKNKANGTCVSPDWVWNGVEWVPRSMVLSTGKIVQGKHCVVYNRMARKLVPMPLGEGIAVDDRLAPANWWKAPIQRS